MYLRALQGYQNAVGANHPRTQVMSSLATSRRDISDKARHGHLHSNIDSILISFVSAGLFGLATALALRLRGYTPIEILGGHLSPVPRNSKLARPNLPA